MSTQVRSPHKEAQPAHVQRQSSFLPPSLSLSSFSLALAQSQSLRSNGLILTAGNKSVRMTLATALPAKATRIGYVNNLINILFAAHLEAYSHAFPPPAPLSPILACHWGHSSSGKMKIGFLFTFLHMLETCPPGEAESDFLRSKDVQQQMRRLYTYIFMYI